MKYLVILLIFTAALANAETQLKRFKTIQNEDGSMACWDDKAGIIVDDRYCNINFTEIKSLMTLQTGESCQPCNDGTLCCTQACVKQCLQGGNNLLNTHSEIVKKYVLGRQFCQRSGEQITGWGFSKNGRAHQLNTHGGMPNPFEHFSVEQVEPSNQFQINLYQHNGSHSQSDLVATLGSFVYDQAEDVIRIDSEVLAPSICSPRVKNTDHYKSFRAQGTKVCCTRRCGGRHGETEMFCRNIPSGDVCHSGPKQCKV